MTGWALGCGQLGLSVARGDVFANFRAESAKLAKIDAIRRASDRTPGVAARGRLGSRARVPIGKKGAIMLENDISAIIVDSAIYVHRTLGPGLLESVYEVALAHVLTKRGLSVTRQQAIPIVFDGIHLGEGFRADLIVNNLVLIELKSQERLVPVHKKQVLTYLRLSGLRLGLLLNFGTAMMKDGIERLATNMP